jgi:hypothetical protein
MAGDGEGDGKGDGDGWRRRWLATVRAMAMAIALLQAICDFLVIVSYTPRETYPYLDDTTSYNWHSKSSNYLRPLSAAFWLVDLSRRFPVVLRLS